jgi:hypothetical protein
MHLQLRFVLSAALLFLANGCLSGQQTTVSVHCRVVDDISGNPVDRARLTLSGGTLPKPIVAYTDSQGACPFTDVPVGQYKLSIDKAGFFPLDDSHGRGSSTGVDATSASPIELGDIILTKYRSISGTVRWQDGDPATGHVLVSVFTVTRGSARPLFPGSIPVQTNDRGEFHLEHLSPARYVLCAFQTGLATTDDPRPRIALPVYLPGGPTPSAGAAFDLRKTPEASGLQLTLSETTGVSVSGRVNVSPALPERTPVLIGLTIAGTPTQAFAGVRTVAGEEFTIPDVPPGQYNLLSITVGKLSHRSFRTISVGTSPVSDLVIDLPEPTNIPGIAWLEPSPKSGSTDGGPSSDSNAPSHVPVEHVVLSAESVNMPLYQDLSRQTNDKGVFHLEGAIAGESYLLRVTPPKGMYVKRLTQDGRELPGAPFPIITGGGAIEIQLKDDCATVNGVIERPEKSNKPAFVVFVPKNRHAEHLFRSTMTGKDGTYTIESVPPGNYDVCAFDRNEEDNYYSQEYLQNFASQSKSVTIAPGQNITVNAKMVDTTANQ